VEHFERLEVGMLYPCRHFRRLRRFILRVSRPSLASFPFSQGNFETSTDVNERSWATEICSRDSEERAIVTASMNTLSYVVQVWLPLIVFQQVQAPRYYKGWVTVTVLNVMLVLAVLGTWWLQKAEDAETQTVGYSGSEGYEESEVRGKAE
jgi:hypothetical protein